MTITTETSTRPKSGRKKRQYLPAAERRELILAAARTVFEKSGLQGATTRDLARAAGINQATLFGHFRSKEALFSAAIVEPLEAMLEASRRRTDSYSSASTRQDLVKRVRIGLEQHLNAMIEMYPLLVQALFSDPELGERIYNGQLEPVFAARAALMEDFIDQSLDPKLVQLASFGMFFAVAMAQALSDKPGDMSEVSRQLSDIILFGTASKNDPRQP